jgi:hypothetical protein
MEAAHRTNLRGSLQALDSFDRALSGVFIPVFGEAEERTLPVFNSICTGRRIAVISRAMCFGTSRANQVLHS